MKLSRDQKAALDAMLDFASSAGRGELLKMGGYAGSGKSTVLGEFAKSAPGLIAYVAPTGRAASVLRRKLAEAGAQTSVKAITNEEMRKSGGIDNALPYCGTIHGLTKRPQTNHRGELLGFEKREALDRPYSLLVVDEASMVGKKWLEELQSFNRPILAVGDHGQLPPVQDSAGLMDDPDIRLEKIHRQAAGNPILALSARVRETGLLDRDLEDGKHLRFLRGAEGSEAIIAMLHDEKIAPLDKGIICAYNRTRCMLNRRAREVLGLSTDPEYPQTGDVIICLKNLHSIGIMNGMRGIALRDAEQDALQPWLITTDVDFKDEGVVMNGEWLQQQHGGMCWPGFLRERPFESVDQFNIEGARFVRHVDEDFKGDRLKTMHMNDQGWPFDFGYAMTCHKAQGSQFKRVVVYIDRRTTPDDPDWRRWIYTAVTRASENLIIIQ